MQEVYIGLFGKHGIVIYLSKLFGSKHHDLRQSIVRSVMNNALFFSDQIDENLRTAIQKDLDVMAPGLSVQVCKSDCPKLKF